MKYLVLLCIGVVCVGLVIGCTEHPPSLLNIFAQRDSSPPVLLDMEMTAPAEACLRFDECIMIKKDAFTIEDNEIIDVSVWDEQLTITFKKPLILGVFSTLEGRVQDLAGNSMRFSIRLWAKNTRIPSLLINEFTTKGSENHPDRVELAVLKGGNLAGVTIKTVNDSHTFGDHQVASGDYVVVAFSKGAVEAGSFLSKEQNGLSSNNGYICVHATPEWNAEVLDCVLYSTKEATTHNGFGSKEVAQMAEELTQGLHWNGSMAKDAIDISKATATRSANRNGFIDTNSANDWYICATGNASFGVKNSTNRHH